MVEVGFLIEYDYEFYTYRFYNAFRILLNEKLVAAGNDIRTLHKSIAIYYESKMIYRKMLYHYYYAEEYSYIAYFLNIYEGSSLSEEEPELMYRIYKTFNDKLLNENPYTFLHMIKDCLLVFHDPFMAERKLSLFMERVSRNELCICKESIEGELLLCQGYLKYNDLSEMFAYFKEASISLNGKTSILSCSGALILYGCIFVLFLYHRKEGK